MADENMVDREALVRAKRILVGLRCGEIVADVGITLLVVSCVYDRPTSWRWVLWCLGLAAVGAVSALTSAAKEKLWRGLGVWE